MNDAHDRPTAQDDPLAAIGATLVAAARRRRQARLRRRRVLVVAATVLGMLTATGAALAVTGTSTGVLALDRWLDTISKRSPSVAPDLGAQRPAPIPDVAPADDMSPPVDVPMGAGATWVGVGYETREGSICGALVDPDTADAPRGGVGCLGERLLRRALADQPARLGGGGGGTATRDGELATVVYQGVARGDVVGLTVTSRGDVAEAAISAPWEPRRWRGRSLRVFFAVLPVPDGNPRQLIGRPMPRLQARLADGSTVAVQLR